IMTALGALFVIPLMLEVLFPWTKRGLAHLSTALGPTPPSQLLLDRTSETPPVGSHTGFTVREMAEIVHTVLRPLSIAERLPPLVIVLGHGSTSLNNPQESAHDCGACGGGQGGPNARAFARMANDPRVRAELATLGTPIPATTWFIGGQR